MSLLPTLSATRPDPGHSGSAAPGRGGRYVAVIALIALCGVLRYWVDPILGERAAIVAFLPALLLVAWFFGRGPLIVGAVLAILAVDFFFDPTPGRLLPRSADDALAVLLYLLTVGGIMLVTTPARAAVERARRAERDSARANARAAHVLENMGDLFIAVDERWCISALNKKTSNHLERPAEEYLGKVLWEAAPQFAESELKELAHRAMQTRQSLTTEMLSPRTERCFEVMLVPDPDGGLSIFGRDVHEQRMVERALAESDRRVGEVVDKLGDCFMALDRAWRITSVNAAGAAFARITPAEAVGRDFWEVFAYARGAPLEEVLHRAMNERVFARHEIVGPSSGRIFDMTIVPTAEGLSCFARDVTILRHAAQTAAEEQRKLRTLIDAMPALVAQIDLDLRYVVANRSYLDWFGLEPSEIEGRSIRDVWGPERFEEMRPLFGRVLAGEKVRYESMLPSSGGVERWADVTIVPNRDGQGRVVGYFALAQDVTRRRQQEEELRKAKERLEFAQAAAQLGTFEWEIASGRVVWTESLERIHGIEAGKFEGTLEAALRDMHPDDAPRAKARIEAALAAPPGTPAQSLRGDADYHNEYRIIRPDGAMRWIEAHARVVRDEQGAPMRLIGVCADVTARRAAEEARRESEERFRIMADAAPILVWLSDMTKACTWFNRGWMEFTGKEMDQLVGDGWTDDVHPEDLDRCLRTYTQSFDARHAFEMEYRLRRHDGEYRWVLDYGVPRFDAGGDFVGYIGSCIDITERKRAEEAVARHADELIRSNQDLESFAYIVSHDLKEPLRGISNYSRFLMEDEGDRLSDDGREKAQTIQRLCRRGYDLLDALLDFSRVGRAQLKLEEVDLGVLASQAAETISAAASPDEGERPSLPVVIMPDMPSIQCDRVLMSQVLMNLIVNGLKYNTSEAPRVEIGIRAGAEDQPPAFYVRDNGIGIDPRHHGAIFRMFKRLHARDAYGGGLGAGLAIVRRIIERHGGRIWLESTPGGGSTFWFTLAPTRTQRGLPLPTHVLAAPTAPGAQRTTASTSVSAPVATGKN